MKTYKQNGWDVPVGWVLVPVEPTENMVAEIQEAAEVSYCECQLENPYQLYIAAIQAAPQPPAKPEVNLFPTDSEIRDVLLACGFTIKDGHGDLKPYVYQAAHRLLAEFGRASKPEVSAEPDHQSMFIDACTDLALINEKLGLDPDEAGSLPILEAIDELMSASDAQAIRDAAHEFEMRLKNGLKSLPRPYFNRVNVDMAIRDVVHSFTAQGAAEVAEAARPANPQDAQDTARLDYLISHEAWVAWSKDRECCRVFAWGDDGHAAPVTGWGSGNWLTGREAIDAAMKKGGAE